MTKPIEKMLKAELIKKVKAQEKAITRLAQRENELYDTIGELQEEYMLIAEENKMMYSEKLSQVLRSNI